MTQFQFSALPAGDFAHLTGKSDAALQAIGARRIVVDEAPGYPCRVTLRDAAIGENVILVNFQHQPNGTAYRANHAIFVIEGAQTTEYAPDQIPEVVSRRIMSIRAFDANHDMVVANIAEGEDAVREVIGEMLVRDDVDYLHLHHAKQGCYAARVDRV